MLLLSTGNLGKLSLWNTSQESIHESHDLSNTLSIIVLSIRRPNQLLDLNHGAMAQMGAHAIINLLQHLSEELARITVGLGINAGIDDFVDEACLDELVAGQSLGLEKCLICLADTESLHECLRCQSLADEAEGRKGRKQEGVRSRVDEVCVGG
jgi:hypothetical protein